MASQTQTIRKLPVQPGRLHDYLYDKIHIVASERDHARATFKAHTGTNRVKQVPIFPTMFSELRHYPRFEMRLDLIDPVPKFINRQWPGVTNQNREAMIRYKTFNYAPSLKIPGTKYEEGNVTGVNRYKYFRRPIIPFLQQVPPDVVLATARGDTFAGQDSFVERPITPPFRSVEIQTDYRDSEVQTDPYTPEYVIRPGEQPELLTLATLVHGRGLPAGLAEVEMIERARAKRAWEATLPPLHDTSQLEKRRRMMDEVETREWALREQEIEKLQEQRLEVLKELLKQREENQRALNIRRLDNVWSKKQEDKEKKIRKIRKDHIKAIRKLIKKRRNLEGKLERRDIVQDLSDYGSQTYAPLTRIGVFLDRGSEKYVVKSKYLSSYQGLLELEQSLPTFVLNPRIKAPKPKTVTKTGFVRRKYRQGEELRQLHEGIKEVKKREAEEPKPPKFLQKIEQPVSRPVTPSVDVPSEVEEEQELAVIFLQKLIRGRAIQNMMFEGKEKRMELIKELRSTHALQEAEQQMKKQDKQATIALQRQRRLHEHKESFVEESLARLEGASIGSTLDFLTKELIRLHEERRIHAFAMLAERQRRIREAEESGRRQVEERRRREHDEIFKQVTKVHQLTVDTYLENVILEAVDGTADEQARGEVQEMATKINDIAYELEESRTHLESEEIVSELIHCFLLPEAQKSTVRERVARRQRKYLLAAHKEIHKDGEEIINDLNNSSPSSKQSEGTGSTHSQKSDKPGSASYKHSTGSRFGEDRASLDQERPGSRQSQSATSRKSSKTEIDHEKPSSRKSSKAEVDQERSSSRQSATSRKASKTEVDQESPSSRQSATSQKSSKADIDQEKSSSRKSSKAEVEDEVKSASRRASGASVDSKQGRSSSGDKLPSEAESAQGERPASQQEERSASHQEEKPPSQNEQRPSSQEARPPSQKELPPSEEEITETKQEMTSPQQERSSSQEDKPLSKSSSRRSSEQRVSSRQDVAEERPASKTSKHSDKPLSRPQSSESQSQRPQSAADRTSPQDEEQQEKQEEETASRKDSNASQQD